MRVGGQRHAPGHFTPGKDPVPIVQEAGWVPGSVWTGAENLAPTEIRSPDRPVRSDSLYRLMKAEGKLVWTVGVQTFRDKGPAPFIVGWFAGQHM